MIYVPEKFRPRHPFPYPPDNHTEFERWYYENYNFQETEREYLPVFWTAYYCRHKFGQDRPAMDRLQQFLDKLDRGKKYYTIVQYDHGIQHDLKDLDIKVYSMSGGRTDFPLPLISQPHDYIRPTWLQRDILVNFIGKVTHEIRAGIISSDPGKEEYYISTCKHELGPYCHLLSRSVFTFCPRGFGPTSFRIQEALQYGSIPVYISDEFVIPCNIPFERYGVLIQAEDAHRIHEILRAIPEEEIKRQQEAIPAIYEQYFTYEGCRKMILSSLQEPAEERV